MKQLGYKNYTYVFRTWGGSDRVWCTATDTITFLTLPFLLVRLFWEVSTLDSLIERWNPQQTHVYQTDLQTYVFISISESKWSFRGEVTVGTWRSSPDCRTLIIRWREKGKCAFQSTRVNCIKMEFNHCAFYFHITINNPNGIASLSCVDCGCDSVQRA